MIDRIWSVIDRIEAGWRAVAQQVPKVLADPRGYPREAMILAAIAALTLLVVVFVVFAAQDAVKARRAKRALGRDPRIPLRWRNAAFVAAMALVVAALVVVAPLTPTGSVVCGSCHATNAAVTSWKSDAHSGVGCLACHSPGGAAGAFQATYTGLALLATGDYGTISVSSAPCARCHQEVAGTVVRDGLRVRHAEMFEARMECALCHPAAGHGGGAAGEVTTAASASVRRSVMSRCITCHDGVEAPAQCSTCHVRPALDAADATAPSGNTEVPLTCDGGCHEPAVQKACVDCHGLELPHPADFMRRHAGMSLRDPGLCAKCHEPASASRALACACHEETNEHGTYSDWFPRHGAAAKSVNAGAGCRCHAPTFCGKCHDEDVMPPSVSTTLPAGL